MFTQPVQYSTTGTIPTSINLADNSIFGAWGTPVVTSPLNDVFRNIRALTASDLISYPVQNNYLTNGSLNNLGYQLGMPWLQNGADTLGSLHTALGIAAINGGFLPISSPYGVPGFSPLGNLVGSNYISPAINYAGIPGFHNSYLNPIFNAVTQATLTGTPFNPVHTYAAPNQVANWTGSPLASAFGGAISGSALSNPYQTNGLANAFHAIANPFQAVLGGNQGYLPGNTYGAGSVPGIGGATSPSTMFGGGTYNSGTNMETQAILQGIYGIGQVNFIDSDSEVIFECAVPGISASNIEVTVVQSQIRVRLIPTAGQRGTTSTATSGATTSRTTSANVSVSPIYTLPVPAFSDVNKIGARVDNGRLVISVPRSGDYQKNITRVKVS